MCINLYMVCAKFHLKTINYFGVCQCLSVYVAVWMQMLCENRRLGQILGSWNEQVFVSCQV